jgi:exopolysaccharide biosynthesis WecB/TagA/CpsF family protein
MVTATSSAPFIQRKVNLFSINYSVVDYESASSILIEKAQKNISYGLTALAVHGLIESVSSRELNEAVNKIDMIVPDGQPIRWAMNYFHKAGLKDRVYGPTLTLHVLEKANRNNLKVYLYGSTSNTLEKLQEFIKKRFPRVKICGVHIDRFRDSTPEEDQEDIDKINNSGAHIVLVGRGCPRQEKWVSAHLGKIDAVMMAVGAAFDFHAGTVPQAPRWMQNNGLEWLFRLIQEPKRLWKRYLVTNTKFIVLFLRHIFKPAALKA